MSWNDFYDQSRNDFASSKILADNKAFGNSAYMLQQCVEKNFKAIILKFNNQTDPKEFGHFPISHFLKKLNSYFKNIQRNTQNKNTLLLRSVSDLKLINIVQDIKTKYMEIMWKNSLGIELTEPECGKIVCLKERVKLMQTRVNLDAMFESYITDLEQQFKSNLSPDAFLLLTNTKNMLEKSNEMYNVSSTDWSEIDLVGIYSPTYKSLYKLLQNIGEPNGVHVMLLLVMLLIVHMPIILNTIPHETIGRYPRMIGNKTSISLYEEHSEALADLSKQVEACLESTKFVFESHEGNKS